MWNFPYLRTAANDLSKYSCCTMDDRWHSTMCLHTATYIGDTVRSSDKKNRLCVQITIVGWKYAIPQLRVYSDVVFDKCIIALLFQVAYKKTKMSHGIIIKIKRLSRTSDIVINVIDISRVVITDTLESRGYNHFETEWMNNRHKK